MNNKTRFSALDGLRGIASVAVCIWHNFLAFYPASGAVNAPEHSHILEKVIYPSPLCIFFGGDFAVYIFFALSGFVLSYKYFVVPDLASLKNQFLRRYVRLMPPAAITIIIACILLNAGWMYNNEAARLAGSWWLNLNWHDVDPSPLNALWQSLWGVWFTKLLPNTAFNSNLLTLFVEMLGSFVIFVFMIACFSLKIRARLRYALHVCLIAFLVFVVTEPHYAVFMIGMLIADIYVNQQRLFDGLAKLGYLFLFLGFYFGSFNIANYNDSLHAPVSKVFMGSLPPWYWAWLCGAISLLLSALMVAPFQRLLESPLFKKLGAYSYSLYLCHTVFLGSFTCFLFVRISEIQKHMGYTTIVLVSFVAGLPLLLLFTHAVKRVDDFATKISRGI
jgi:peptidoglycan/LPS O-acetylase OafA/YrhL